MDISTFTGTCPTSSGAGGGGTVTSITEDVNLFPEVLVNGVVSYTITSSGTFAWSKVKQPAHTFWAGPTSGPDAVPIFRAIDPTDLPVIFWTLTGNSGTTAGPNFIGTTDAVDWVWKTNNVEAGRIKSAAAGTRPGHLLFGDWTADNAVTNVFHKLDDTDTGPAASFVQQNVATTTGASRYDYKALQVNSIQKQPTDGAVFQTGMGVFVFTDLDQTASPSNFEASGITSQVRWGNAPIPAAGGHSKALVAADGATRVLGIESQLTKPFYQSDGITPMLGAGLLDSPTQQVCIAANLNSEVPLHNPGGDPTTSDTSSTGVAACSFPGGNSPWTQARQGIGFLSYGTANKNWTKHFLARNDADGSVGSLTTPGSTTQFEVDYTGGLFSRFGYIRPNAATAANSSGDAFLIDEDLIQVNKNLLTIFSNQRTANYGIFMRQDTSAWATGAAIGIQMNTTSGGGAGGGSFTTDFINCFKGGSAGANKKFWVETNGAINGRALDIGPRSDSDVAITDAVQVSDQNYTGMSGNMLDIAQYATTSRFGIYQRNQTGAYSGDFFGVQAGTDGLGAPSGTFTGNLLSYQYPQGTNKLIIDYRPQLIMAQIAAPAAFGAGFGQIYFDTADSKWHVVDGAGNHAI